MKVWLLDNGSIVIEHTQLMWNVAGAAGADPRLQRPDRARRRALPLRHRLRPRAHERACCPFELPGADAGADDPGAARALRLPARRRDDARQLAPALRPRRRQQALHGQRARAATRRSSRRRATTSRSSSSATRTRRWDYEGAQLRDRLRRRRAREGPLAVRDARPHGRPLLAARRSRTRARSRCCSRSTSSTRARRCEKGIQPGFHNDPVAGVRSIRRVKDARRRARRGHLLLARHGRLADATGTRPTSTRSRRTDDGQAGRTGSRSSPAPRRGSARRSPTSSPTRARRSSSPTSTARARRRPRRSGRAIGPRRSTSRTEDDVQRMVDETRRRLRQARRARERRRDRPVHALGRHRLRRVAPDHVRQPRRHVPDQPLRVRSRCARPATGASSTSPRTSILAGTPNLAHYVASKGGVLGVHARARPRARQVRHHRQLGRARADRDRGRAGEPARGGVRVRPDAPGDPAPRRRRRHRAGRRLPRLRGGRLGDRARCSSPTAGMTHN